MNASGLRSCRSSGEDEEKERKRASEGQREREASFERRVNEKRRAPPTIRSFEPDFGIRIRYPFFSEEHHGEAARFMRTRATEISPPPRTVNVRRPASENRATMGNKGEREIVGVASSGARNHVPFVPLGNILLRLADGRTVKKEDRLVGLLRTDVTWRNTITTIPPSLPLPPPFLLLSPSIDSLAVISSPSVSWSRGRDPPRCCSCRSSLTSARRSNASQSRHRLKKSASFRRL